MHALLALFFLAQPFWETRPPETWSLQEIETLRCNSPWAQTIGPGQPMVVSLATAAPIEEAESELRLRSKGALQEPDADYLTYLAEHRQQVFVVAIPYPALDKLGKAEEEKRLEEETVMIIGRHTYHMLGHFPPVPSDPVLRLIFPREVRQSDKRVIFRLSLPGIEFPDRQAEFTVKEMMYRGKLEM